MSNVNDTDLLSRSIKNIGRLSSKRKPRWALVAEQFLVGSTTAHALCGRFGHDPDELAGGCLSCEQGFAKYCAACAEEF